MKLRRDLLIAFLIAVIVNSAVCGWIFFEQGSLRINATDDFRKIHTGMTMPEVQRILARNHVECKKGRCFFLDFRRAYAFDFDNGGKLYNKAVYRRIYYDIPTF